MLHGFGGAQGLLGGQQARGRPEEHWSMCQAPRAAAVGLPTDFVHLQQDTQQQLQAAQQEPQDAQQLLLQRSVALQAAQLRQEQQAAQAQAHADVKARMESLKRSVSCRRRRIAELKQENLARCAC
jgi:hypothetical protein